MLFVVTVVLLVSPFAAAISTMTSTIVVQPQKNALPTNSNFTHTIFCELQSATWCPDCPTAVTALSNIYKSNDYPFYYVSLVYDMNPNAKNRIHDYRSYLHPGYIAFPTVYFDGGDKNYIGRNGPSVNATAAAYRQIIDDVGNRSVTVPIELSSKVIWLGDGKLTVTLTEPGS